MSESQSRDRDNNKQPAKEDDSANVSRTIGDEAGLYSTADGTRHLERAKEKDQEAPVEGNG